MQKLCHLSDVRTVPGINATSRLSVGWEGFWRRGLAGRRGGCRGESQKEEEKSLIKLLQSAQVMPSACCLPRCLLPASACQQGARQGWGRWACLAGCVGGWGVGLFIKLAICPTTYYICSPIFMDFSSFFRSRVQLDSAPAILSKRSDVVSSSVLSSGKSMDKIYLRESESEKIWFLFDSNIQDFLWTWT